MQGHSKLETTQIYTQIAIKKLKEVHSQTHPAKSRKQKCMTLIEEETTEENLLEMLLQESEEVT